MIKWASLAIIVLLFPFSFFSSAADSKNIDILFVTDFDSSDSYRNGAELGVVEANVQGQFLGIEYRLLEQGTGRQTLADTSAEPVAVIVAGSNELLSQISEVNKEWGLPIFNIAIADNELRQDCGANIFHISPSQQMLRDAEAQWATQNSGEIVIAEAWHPDFVKFASRDLNKRYTERYSMLMNSDAWAGWVATRMLAEAVARTNSSEPSDILNYLRGSLEFDGQKGVPHTFRKNGQLRQPLLITKAGKLLGEAPVRGAAKFEDLDSLGINPCQ